MIPPQRIRLMGFSLLAVLSGGTFLGIPIVGYPRPTVARGLALGIAGGVFGASLLALGYALGRGRYQADQATVPSPAPATEGPPNSEEAKRWLRILLKQQENDTRVPEQSQTVSRTGPKDTSPLS